MTKKLKEMILTRASKTDIDVDGDIIRIFDKKYYVHLNHEYVEEVK